MFEHVAQLSPTMLAGDYAPNGWLQECPHPLSKQVWGNAASFAPADAERLGIEEGNTVVLSGSDDVFVPLPAVILPGQATGTVGTNVGADVRPLGPRVGIEPMEGPSLLIRTQQEFGQHGRDLLRSVPPSHPELTPEDHAPPTFYPPWDYDSPS